jgi:hypothetical protein
MAYGSRWRRTAHQNAFCNASVFGHLQHNCGYVPQCVNCGEAYLLGKCSTPKQQVKFCSCGQNTWPAGRALLNEEAKVTQGRRELNAAREAVQPADLLCWRQLWLDLAQSRKVWDLDGTTSSKGVMLRLLPHLIHKPLPGWSWKTLNRPDRPTPGRWARLPSLHPLSWKTPNRPP